MDNKGQTLMLSILFAVVIFILGILFINFIRPVVVDTQGSMDCSNVSGISDGNKLTCLIVDGTVPYFIALVVSLAGGVLLSRLLV